MLPVSLRSDIETVNSVTSHDDLVYAPRLKPCAPSSKKTNAAFILSRGGMSVPSANVPYSEAHRFLV